MDIQCHFAMFSGNYNDSIPFLLLNDLLKFNQTSCPSVGQGWWHSDSLITKAEHSANTYLSLIQLQFRFRIGWRRSYSADLYCDQSTISSNQLISFGSSWDATCTNSPNPVCGSTAIGNTNFYCTDYSTTEDWTVGENNFTHTFSNSEKEWHVRYVHEGFPMLSTQTEYISRKPINVLHD